MAIKCSADAAYYRCALLEDIIPWWLRHAIDEEAGGLCSCIRDDGTLVSRDKWLWSQWRAVWVFSRLYNRVERKQQYLDVAQRICDFVTRHGWDEDVGGWVLVLNADGSVKRGCESIYSDGFAIYGLTELARATGDDAVTALACKTADRAIQRLQGPHDTVPHFPYPIPKGMRVHGLPMMFSFVLWELGALTNEPRYLQASQTMSDEVFERFYRPDRDLVLERIAADGGECPPPEGTAVVPGHVIEDMWFQLVMAQARGQTQRCAESCRLMQRHMALGWDEQYGGLLLALDADGRDEVGWDFPDSKLWWPQTEALCGLLLAHEHCGEAWCLQWYEKVRDYALAHYPLPEHGEWIQKLDRYGNPLEGTPSLPVKDPFHLPRALIYAIETLDRLARATAQSSRM